MFSVDISKVKHLIIYYSLHNPPIKHGETQINIEAFIIRKIHGKHLLIGLLGQIFDDLILSQFLLLILKFLILVAPHLLDIITGSHQSLK